jgi:hypothetical protein
LGTGIIGKILLTLNCTFLKNKLNKINFALFGGQAAFNSLIAFYLRTLGKAGAVPSLLVPLKL